MMATCNSDGRPREFRPKLIGSAAVFLRLSRIKITTPFMTIPPQRLVRSFEQFNPYTALA